MPEHKTNNDHLTEIIHVPDEGHDVQSNPLLSLDPGMVVWTWLVFFIFLFVLWKYAWKPILKVLDDREKSIQKSLDDVEAAKRMLNEASEKQHQLIEKGQKKAEDIVTNALDSARRLANDINEKAKQDAEKRLHEAVSQIALQKRQAIDELKSEVSVLAVSIASKLIEANLDDGKNQMLAENYLIEISR